MTFRIELATSAERELRTLDCETRRRVAHAIDDLAADPRPAGVRALRGGAELYRIRVGAWRVVYRIEDDSLVVFIVRVGHRRDVYRRR